MEQVELMTVLNGLLQSWENEIIEFKQAGNDYKTDKIGEYFSALANEANLRDVEKAWLVFGIDNKTRAVVGTQYRSDPEQLQSTKMQVAQSTEPSITCRHIHELHHPQGRVVLFEIPAAPQGLPIAWKGHYYARAGESLTHLGLDKLDAIRQQTLNADWSAQVVPDATLEHLDEHAVQKARESFARKYANRFPDDEVMSWSLATFLDRAKVTQDGKITRTALLLLGKPESTHLLSPHPAQLTWRLEGQERAYEHFGLPFLLNTTALYQKIRNIQLRLLPNDELLAVEVAKYDQKVVLEALHNCIVHQDYTRSARIVVTEKPDKLIFENEGVFFEGTPDAYISGDKTPRRYRNPFLAQAMAELNMIDTMGYGIHAMYRSQAQRYLPMPDYSLDESNLVRLTVYGGVVDPAYSRILMQKTNLSFTGILALDRVQKKLPLPDDMVKHLRQKGLIEGRKPNFHVSAQIAEATDKKAEYIRTRSLDDKHYESLLLEYLDKFGKASRQDIDKFLLDKLSEALDEEQKKNKIANLLTKLRRSGVIANCGSRKASEWVLAEKNAE